MSSTYRREEVEKILAAAQEDVDGLLAALRSGIYPDNLTRFAVHLQIMLNEPQPTRYAMLVAAMAERLLRADQ